MLTLTEQRNVKALLQMGRKYKVVDTTGRIEALYAKNISEIEMIRKDFPQCIFDVFLIVDNGQVELVS